jgi:hypothetical protein
MPHRFVILTLSRAKGEEPAFAVAFVLAFLICHSRRESAGSAERRAPSEASSLNRRVIGVVYL